MKLVTLAVFLLSLLVSGGYVHSQRNARNNLFEYCTTKAHGWPYPWRIDNCPCDGCGGLKEFPPEAKLWNGGAVLLLSGMTAGALHLVLKSRMFPPVAGR
jgi:hypothetical protein